MPYQDISLGRRDSTGSTYGMTNYALALGVQLIVRSSSRKGRIETIFAASWMGAQRLQRKSKNEALRPLNQKAIFLAPAVSVETV